MLEKTRTVLRRIPESLTVVFTTSDEDSRTTRVHLDPDIWEDMGKPETITVTIEPGDKLNSPD